MRRFSTKYNYDPKLDPTTWRDGYNPTAFSQYNDPIKKALRHEKQKSTLARANAPRIAITAKKRCAREKAEEQAAETVRQTVRALEFALTELQQVPAPSRYQSFVNVKQLHNVIVHLKNKCGVRFSDTEDPFKHKISLDH